MPFKKDKQFYKFCFYGFFKNLRFFDAFFILYLKHKGLSYTEIGSLYALREIITNLSEIPTGVIADTYGRKKSLILSFLFYIISFLFFYWGDNYTWFLMAFLLYGIAEALRSGTHKAMIMDYLKLKSWSNEKINYYGHTRACSQRGSALSSLIAGGIVFYTGQYEMIFLLSIFPYLFNLVLVWSYPSEIDLPDKKKQTGYKQSLKSLWLVLQSKEVWKIIHTAAVFTAYQKSIKDYIQPVMKLVVINLPLFIGFSQDKKIGLGIGILFFFLYLLTSFASKYSEKIAQKIPDIAVKSLWIGFLSGLAGGYFFERKYWWLSLLFFTLIYLIENIRKPVLTGYLSNAVPNKIFTSVLSAQSFYRTLLTSFLSLIFGFLADQVSLGYALLIVSGVLLLISFFLKNCKNTKSRKFINV